MKTNISVEITDEERLKLGRRYHNTNNKRLLTRLELNDIVQNFVKSLIDYDGSIKQDTDKIVKGQWTKLYIYNGKQISKKEWDLVPDGPRKFYRLGELERRANGVSEKDFEN